MKPLRHMLPSQGPVREAHSPRFTATPSSQQVRLIFGFSPLKKKKGVTRTDRSEERISLPP
jgi:hypothetical protein